jgi:hypothetical protein
MTHPKDLSALWREREAAYAAVNRVSQCLHNDQAPFPNATMGPRCAMPLTAKLSPSAPSLSTTEMRLRPGPGVRRALGRLPHTA